MKTNHQYDDFRNLVQPALQSKLAELSLLGYGTYQESQLWSFLVKKKWKKPKVDILIHEIVQEILSLKPGDFMSFQTVEALKSSQFTLPDGEDWNELMK
jgi:uncharacterized lipoprotein YddW (UPF0748 family)